MLMFKQRVFPASLKLQNDIFFKVTLINMAPKYVMK